MKEDDFGHEIRVGNAIRNYQVIQVQHGGTYVDPITAKPRQFDFRCCLTKKNASLLLAVECKNLSPLVPMVICGIKRRANEAFHDLIESRQGTFETHSSIITGLSSITRRATLENTLYVPEAIVGKSLTRIQADKKSMVRSQDSDIYDKWAQALSSAVELTESACESAKRFSVAHFYTAILPVVVVPDGLIWQVSYNEVGEVPNDPIQVNECELFVGREIEVGGEKGTPFFHRFTFSHVHFFTLTGFSSFLSKMTIDDCAWDKLFTTKSIDRHSA